MTDKEIIKKFLSDRDISKNSFYKKTGLSMGYLDSGKSITLENSKIIIKSFPGLAAPLGMSGAEIDSTSSNVNEPSGEYVAEKSNFSKLRELHLTEEQEVLLKAIEDDLIEKQNKIIDLYAIKEKLIKMI